MAREDLSLLEDALRVGARELTARRQDDTEEAWEHVLTALTAAAAEAVPGASYVGLTLRAGPGGNGHEQDLLSCAPSHEAIAALDLAQSELREGPCVDALSAGELTVLRVDDFAAEARWPRFVPLARQAGVASLLSYALAPPGQAPGAMNFYATEAAAFTDPVARTVAAAFATQASIALYGRSRVRNLHVALASRDVIGRAKGILMERFDFREDEAFSLLVRSSQDTNMKVVDVAHWLSDEVDRRAENRSRGTAADHGEDRG
ncbi:GAF and ANTAR domain-containing protein [Actinomycetospora sp. TBRC 11914]|uniref:GAF and ANTAR domain-containing protein n=1 Tax=Actinomycetospora sp. TBRC 11914 TaxID=2729387 RepID=UPI00145E47D4|nr:GAF and ANTAR domain-containing protein [Actinomycetospora sp. TBRC 11914]NMO94081.1 GAF and ANTAR domain-containing protein [Actinomycetospora sp. TBRC 11914]